MMGRLISHTSAMYVTLTVYVHLLMKPVTVSEQNNKRPLTVKTNAFIVTACINTFGSTEHVVL